jgi:pimeloyl-ACP methyl ester carboxylesterase
MILPRLVLVPGLDGTGILFRPFLHAWTGPTTVLDLPPDPALGYEELLPVLQRHLPREEPFFLLGESFSGPLVLRLAEARPRGLVGLILCVTFACNPLGRLGCLARFLARPPLISAVPRFVVRRMLLGGIADPDLSALLTEAIQRTPAPVVGTRIRALTKVNATESLHACQLPLLILSARSDALVPRRCAVHMRRHAPCAEWHEYPGPHLLLQTRPAEAAQRIRAFKEGKS